MEKIYFFVGGCAFTGIITGIIFYTNNNNRKLTDEELRIQQNRNPGTKLYRVQDLRKYVKET